MIENKNDNTNSNKQIQENIDNNKETQLIPSFDEFIDLKYDEFSVSCSDVISRLFSNNLFCCSLRIYSKDRFNVEIKVKKVIGDFERLYDIINSKYSKIKLPEFPSKFTLLLKDEELLIYFEDLLNRIINAAKDHDEMKIIYLKFIYDFFTLNTPKEIVSPMDPQIIEFMFSSEKPPSSLVTPKKIKKINFNENKNNSSASKKNSQQDSSDKISEDLDDSFNLIDIEWKGIFVKISEIDSFIGNIKIIAQCLFIYKNKDKYDYVIPLYGINYNIQRIKNKESQYINPQEIYDLYNSNIPLNNIKLQDINSEIIFDIYHNYSSFKIGIIFQNSNTLSQVKNFLNLLEYCSYNNKDCIPSQYIKALDEKYTNIYGLIYLHIDSLQIPEFDGECFLSITCMPYCFPTINISNDENIQNKIYEINQNVLFPIHNRFGKIKFEIYKDVMKGVLIKSKEKEVIYEQTIELIKLLNEYNKNEINLILNDVSTDKESETPLLTRNYTTIENSTLDKMNCKTNLLIKIKDFSSPFVLLEKNRNKNILEDNEAGDDNLGVKILLKRLKKIFYLLDQINLIYKSIFRFKYPIFSLICMIVILADLIIFETKYIMSFFIFITIIILVSNCTIYKQYFEKYINKFIFFYKNPYDKSSMLVSSKKEIEDREFQNPDYLIEKEEINILTDIIDPLTNINKYKLKYFSFLLKITKYVGTVEKIKNLFLWTDPKLSIYFLILLIIFYLIVVKIDFKYLLIFSMGKKFIIGFFYYKQKYHNNLEIARILLEHCVLKWREEMEKKDTKNIFQRINSNIDLSCIRAYDNKFRNIILNVFYHNSNAVLTDTIFNIVNSLKDMQIEIAKCEEVLRIKKSSPLYKFCKNNNKMLDKEVEPEDIFYYFVQNVKSDFYILRNKENENKTNFIDHRNDSLKYVSLSSENFDYDKYDINNSEKKNNNKEKAD